MHGIMHLAVALDVVCTLSNRHIVRVGIFRFQVCIQHFPVQLVADDNAVALDVVGNLSDRHIFRVGIFCFQVSV